MAACNEHCVIGVECLNANIKDVALSSLERKGNADDKCYQLLLCNSIGTTVDCKFFLFFFFQQYLVTKIIFRKNRFFSCKEINRPFLFKFLFNFL